MTGHSIRVQDPVRVARRLRLTMLVKSVASSDGGLRHSAQESGDIPTLRYSPENPSPALPNADDRHMGKFRGGTHDQATCSPDRHSGRAGPAAAQTAAPAATTQEKQQSVRSTTEAGSTGTTGAATAKQQKKNVETSKQSSSMTTDRKPKAIKNVCNNGSTSDL